MSKWEDASPERLAVLERAVGALGLEVYEESGSWWVNETGGSPDDRDGPYASKSQALGMTLQGLGDEEIADVAGEDADSPSFPAR